MDAQSSLIKPTTLTPSIKLNAEICFHIAKSEICDPGGTAHPEIGSLGMEGVALQGSSYRPGKQVVLNIQHVRFWPSESFRALTPRLFNPLFAGTPLHTCSTGRLVTSMDGSTFKIGIHWYLRRSCWTKGPTKEKKGPPRSVLAQHGIGESRT